MPAFFVKQRSDASEALAQGVFEASILHLQYRIFELLTHPTLRIECAKKTVVRGLHDTLE
jgi:hypothetical protein